MNENTSAQKLTLALLTSEASAGAVEEVSIPGHDLTNPTYEDFFRLVIENLEGLVEDELNNEEDNEVIFADDLPARLRKVFESLKKFKNDPAADVSALRANVSALAELENYYSAKLAVESKNLSEAAGDSPSLAPELEVEGGLLNPKLLEQASKRVVASLEKVLSEIKKLRLGIEKIDEIG